MLRESELMSRACIVKQRPSRGAAYDGETYRKAIILLTDGRNVTGGKNNHNANRHGARGRVKDGRPGVTGASRAGNMPDSRTTAVRENIRNASAGRPIAVYTITFRTDDDPAENPMRNCASDPEKYLDPVSNTVLRPHFEAIAGESGELRPSG